MTTELIARLKRSPPGTYLLTGPQSPRVGHDLLLSLRNHEPCGSCKLCKQVLTNNHPDLILVTSPNMEETRRLVTLNLSRPHDGPRVIVIDGKISAQVQNTLLKMLEEPRGSRILLMLDLPSLIDTVLSRAIIIKAPQPLPRIDKAVFKMADTLLDLAEQKRTLSLLEAAKAIEPERVRPILDAMIIRAAERAMIDGNTRRIDMAQLLLEVTVRGRPFENAILILAGSPRGQAS